MTDVTQILHQIANGDDAASEQLLPLVYDELRKLAGVRLANEKPGQTLQATALVHEAYLRLLGPEGDSSWKGRGHFFAAAAEAMRRILVDRARRKMAQKRGGGEFTRVPLEDISVDVASPSDRLVTLDEALEHLEKLDPVKSQLVKLRYFAGLTAAEAANALQIGESTADKYWAYAKVWLLAEMERIENSRL